MSTGSEGAAGAETASALLRSETAEDHRRAERSDFQQAFVSGRLPRALYVRWLEQMWWVYRELEGRLWTAPCRKRYTGLLADSRRRTPDLETDLAHFDVAAPSGSATPTTSAFTRQLAAWAEQQSRALFGVLYVLEGSTNGSRFVARGVRKSYRLTGREGSAFLDPYGDDQPAQWAEFKRHLDASLSCADAPALVEGARATFDALTQIGVELLATAEG